MKMKRFLISALVLLMTGWSFAATGGEEGSNLSAQTDTGRLEKDAKKLEKRLKDEGWREVSGQPPMLQQIYSAYKLKNELGADLQPKYAFGEAKAVGQFLSAAKLLATEKAKNDLVNQLAKDIKAKAKSSAIEKSKPVVSQRMNPITTVFVFQRKLANGNTEVMVSIAYDRKTVTDIFKTVVYEQSGLKLKN